MNNNKRERKKEFTLLVITYFLVTVLDLVLTYIATPNLVFEGNPLVNAFSWGWVELVALNAVTYVLYVIMAYYGFIRYKPPRSGETELRRYLADINYGDPDKVVPMMWKLPKHWGPQMACLCWSASLALPLSRLIIVFEWLLMILRIPWRAFFKVVAVFPGGRIDMFLAVLVAWGLSFLWIRLEFKENLKRIKKEDEGI